MTVFALIAPIGLSAWGTATFLDWFVPTFLMPIGNGVFSHFNIPITFTWKPLAPDVADSFLNIAQAIEMIKPEITAL